MRHVARPVQGDYVMNRLSPSKTALSLCITLLAVLVLVASPALAQVTSGTISGTVQDPTGAYVKGASVTITNPATGLIRKVMTNDDGQFVAPSLLPGTYNITVEAPGFKKLESTGFVLSAADKLNAGTLTLAMGTTQESVNVTADAGQVQLQSNSGERSDVITGKQLNDVALNGRMVLDYVKLVPGVISSFDGHASGTGGIDAFNINGTRANQHEFTIDGASNVDTGNNGGTHVTINPDAIEEVKILTSNYQAEFGKAAGGQVVLTTKSGSNQFHGNGRFFHRNEGLNANDWFANNSSTSIAKYRYNYAGYQIGGPIVKDKLFFFWSQEFYRQLVPVSGVTQFYVPTDLEREGDFSQSIDGNGNAIVIAGPGITDNKITPTPEQQAVFEQVQKILKLYPEPNFNGYGQGSSPANFNYTTTISFGNPRREDILRVDYQLNNNHHLFGRWIHNSDNQSAPILPWPGFGTFACAGAINFPGGCTSKHPGWNLSLNLVSTITPTVLNEFSVGPSVTKTLSEGVNGNLSVGKNGIDLPLFFPVDPDQSIPDMGFNDLPNTNFGWSYLGATPWHQANTTINVNDSLSWVKHNHAFKFGVFYQRNRKDQIAWGNVNGQFSFSRTPTNGGTCPTESECTLGDPYASALIGGFDWFQQSSSRPIGYFRYNQLEFYAQDTWKITPRLTLDYGMRFAWIPPQYDDRNQVAIFDPAAYVQADAVKIDPDTGQILTDQGGNPLNGMEFTKNNTVPTGGWDNRGIMPEPRLGFAYDLLGDHKTVLRGGFGMMHDRTQGNLIFNNVFNNPATVITPQVTNNNIANLPALAAQAAAGITSPLGNIFGAARNGKVPTVYSFSLGVQHEIGRGITLDAAYVGTLSRHLVTARDINSIPYLTEFQAAAQNPNACGFDGEVPAVEPNLPPEYAAAGFNFSSKCAYPTAYLVPYKGYGQVEFLQFDGTSNYNSLQVSLQRRFSNGLTFGGVYTWSKALTTASSDEDFQDPFNPRNLDYRAAGWDRTHVVAINYVYDVPGLTKHFGGPKWLSYVTDNYQLSGITQFSTGSPIDTGLWTQGNVLTGGNDWTKIQALYWSVDRSGNLVLPSLGVPQRGTRDILRTGGMQNWDMSLFKNIPLGGERYSLQLRLEAFNIFNHPNFDNKNTDVTFTAPRWDGDNNVFIPMSLTKNDNWGHYTSQYSGNGGPRVLQLGAKFYF